MTDTVDYRLPMGVLGKLVAGKWVRKDVEKIFAYRRQIVSKLLAAK
jgi:ligand-binding SRPBCC domain-containing protein